MTVLVWRQRTNGGRILVRARWIALEGQQVQDELHGAGDMVGVMDSVMSWALTAVQMGMGISIKWEI